MVVTYLKSSPLVDMLIMPLVRQAEQQCREALQTGADAERIELHFDENRKADASFATFPLAAKLKKKPAEIAVDFASKAKPTALVSKITALNGFVNFHFSEKFYFEALKEALNKKHGCGVKTGKKTIVEYSCPNIGKPLHIGHIRSTIYGEALKNILACQGASTIGFNYLGDAGAQVAKLILSFELFKHLPEIKTEKDLLNYYVEINKKIEENAELKQRERGILEKIEKGEKSISRELEKVRKLSLSAFKSNYALLGVTFDETKGESAFIEDAKKAIKECLKKGVAFRDKQGEIVADLEPLPNAVLMRSNGTTLYIARDLALADYRYKKYKFDKTLYITGNEQNLHFQQLFAILKKLGRNYNNKHLGFGLIKIEGEKLSTREGRIILLEEVINKAKEAAKQEILKREQLSGKELEKRSLAIGLSALKFSILRVSPEKEINFDYNSMVSFEGDTGPYVQYSLVRCRSILQKAEKQKKEAKKKYELNPEEKQLLLYLSQFSLVIENAARNSAPHALCDYLLRLAACFSKFYATHSVLDAETQQARETRLKIVKATANVLEKGLTILGITPLEKM